MTEAQSDISGAPMVEPKDHALGEPGLEMGIPGGPEDSGSECTLEGIERRPLREILTVAAPSVVTMTSYTVMQFIDVLMVSRIGPEPVYVSAAGNGSIAAWLSIALPLGAAGVVNTFVSQNLGAGRPREGAGYVWTAVWLCALWYLLAVLPFSFFAGTIFGWTGHDGELLRLEVPYAQIALLGAGPILVSRTLQHYFYGMHRPNVVMIAAIAGNVVNLFANAAFIFGPAGMPLGDGALSGVVRPFTEAAAWAAGWLGMHEGMGVVGAAWGTLAGGVVELAIPAALFLGGKYAREFGSRERWRPSGRRSLELFRLGWPAGLMFLNELFCWSYLMVVLLPAAGEAAGEDPVVHNTAGWIALRYMHVSFMPAVGLSIAMTAVVGRCMGEKRPDLASSRTWLGVRIALIYMGVCALVFFTFRRELIGIFADSGLAPGEGAASAEAVIDVGARVMIAAAVFQLFDAVAITLTGALRGAGDTVFPGVATIVLSWGCIVVGGHALIELAPGLGSVGPWIGGASYIMLLGVVLLVRFLSGKWKTMSVVQEEPVSA